MAVPFRKTSRTVKRKRRTHFKLEAASLTLCTNCGISLKPHHVCKECGFYKGKEAIKVNN